MKYEGGGVPNWLPKKLPYKTLVLLGMNMGNLPHKPQKFQK